jgi:PD-(D/E)XK nuclease superfamily
MRRRVIVVNGPLAFRMRRLEAARSGDVGLDILTLPLLAARLAGGFCRLADRDLLSSAIAAALEAGGFGDIDKVRSLPGMVRAVMQTLDRAWASDLDLEALAAGSSRLADLAMIQRRVRAALPAGIMLPRDIRDAALARVHFAPILFGRVTLDRMIDVDPVWRSLLVALLSHVDVSWTAVGDADRSWFLGRLSVVEETAPRQLGGDLCADPRAEVVEALRWTRELLSRGDVAAADIALVAASPATWDEHMLVLASDANLPVHFSHGIPALSTREGQTCAALADVLINGLSQDRVRRLLRGVSPRVSKLLPSDWAIGLPRRAGLFTIEQWRLALAASRDKRTEPEAAEQVLLPLLELLTQGATRADLAGRSLLTGASLGLWRDALRVAPAAALALSLQSLRVRDDRDPGNSVVWCPASHVIGAPRPWVRLVGISGRAWPRSESEDPLLPNHILPRRRLAPVSITERDRQAFEVLLGQTPRGMVISRSQRSTEGTMQCASALWPAAVTARARTRTRIPEHAFSEADRLLARPTEAGQSARIKASRSCWRNWHLSEVTSHDGTLRAGHPAVERALARLHSATSLKRLARDPLGFLWRYALGMRSVPLAQHPLLLDPLMFGDLVHELLRRTIDALEPDPGFVRASRDEIEIALDEAAKIVAVRWPLERPVPPNLLWADTLDEAVRRSLRGLTIDESFQTGTRSWTELGFGQAAPSVDSDVPWPVDREILIGEAQLRLGGRIDRVDLTANGEAVRISDYKTGATPRNAHNIVVDRGRELQRVLYAMAVQQLLPGATAVISRLVFLDATPTRCQLSGATLDNAADEVTRFLDIACSLVRRGSVCPGPDAQDCYNDLRLALPAELDSYFHRKAASFGAACRELSPLWSKQ